MPCTRYIEAATLLVTTTRTITMKVCLLLAALALASTSALGDAESEQLRYFKVNITQNIVQTP